MQQSSFTHFLMLCILVFSFFDLPLVVFATKSKPNDQTSPVQYLTNQELQKAHGITTLVSQVLRVAGEDWYTTHPIQEFEMLSTQLKAYGKPTEKLLLVKSELKKMSRLSLYRTKF